MNRLNSKNWMKIRINTKAKTFTFTNELTFKSEKECALTIKSKQYVPINKKRLEALIKDGWTETTQETKKTDTDVPRASGWTPQFIVGDPKVEEDIRRYVESQKQKKGVEFVRGATIKERSQVEADFLSRAPKPVKVKGFDYSKSYEQYNKKLEKIIEKEKEAMEEYCK